MCHKTNLSGINMWSGGSLDGCHWSFLTLFQSYIHPILRSSNLPLFNSSNLTLFQFYTLPISHFSSYKYTHNVDTRDPIGSKNIVIFERVSIQTKHCTSINHSQHEMYATHHIFQILPNKWINTCTLLFI